VDSDHIPVCLELEPEEEREKRGGRRKRKRCSNGEKRNIILGYRGRKEEYWKKTEEKGWEEDQKGEHEDRIWNKLKYLIKEAMIRR